MKQQPIKNLLFWQKLSMLFIVLLFVKFELFGGQVETVKSGVWSDASIWNTGEVPQSINEIRIKHEVTLDLDWEVNYHLIIDALGVLNIPSTYTLKNPRTLDVYGTITGEGTLKNEKILNIYSPISIQHFSSHVPNEANLVTYFFSNQDIFYNVTDGKGFHNIRITKENPSHDILIDQPEEEILVNQYLYFFVMADSVHIKFKKLEVKGSLHGLAEGGKAVAEVSEGVLLHGNYYAVCHDELILSQLKLVGTEKQNISTIGLPEIKHLEVNNPKGVFYDGMESDESYYGLKVLDSIIFTQGIMEVTDTLFQLILTDGCQVMNASDSSHIFGYIDVYLGKEGSKAIFPLGDRNHYRPVQLSNIKSNHEGFMRMGMLLADANELSDSTENLYQVNEVRYYDVSFAGEQDGDFSIEISLTDDEKTSLEGLTLAKLNQDSVWVNIGPIQLSQLESISSIISTNFKGFGFFAVARATPPVPLPVELISFQAEQQKKSILLHWTTASEVNNSHFEVEYAKDGVHFESIGLLEGKGNSAERTEYEYTHSNLNSGVHYYRLKQVDFDGATTYSQVLNTQVIHDKETHVAIFPNPSSEYINVQSNCEDEVKSFSIFNLNGELMTKESLQYETPIQREISIDTYPKGTYILMLQLENGNIASEHFIKE